MDANEGKVYRFRPIGPSIDGSQTGHSELDPWLVQAAIDDLRKRLAALEPQPKAPLITIQEANDRSDAARKHREDNPVGNGIACSNCGHEMRNSGHGISYGDDRGCDHIHCPSCQFRATVEY